MKMTHWFECYDDNLQALTQPEGIGIIGLAWAGNQVGIDFTSLSCPNLEKTKILAVRLYDMEGNNVYNDHYFAVTVDGMSNYYNEMRCNVTFSYEMRVRTLKKGYLHWDHK